MRGIVIGAGDTCVIEKYNFYDAFTSMAGLDGTRFYLGCSKIPTQTVLQSCEL